MDAPAAEDASAAAGAKGGGGEKKAVDGRHLRSERSRAAIVDAMLELLRSGNTAPSSTEIAERAGVTQRTVFNHFSDMHTLMTAVMTRNGEHILPLVPEVVTDGPVDARIEYFCERATAINEDSMHIRWAVLTHPAGQRFGILGVQFMRDLMRERLLGVFAPELAALDAAEPGHADVVVRILEVEMDPLTWRIRRHQNGQTFEAAAADLRALFRLVLTAPAEG